MIGIRVVWTAHNLLPHEPVFADDISARRYLVRSSDLVIAHSRSTLDQLAELGAAASRVAVIEHGPMGEVPATRALRVPGTGDGPRQFLFIGGVKEYKGVDDLVAAFLALPPDVAACLTVAGHCPDHGLRSRLRASASRPGTRITMRLQHIPEAELTRLLAAADVVVLPYRRVTTSGSAMLALTHGRPLIVPNLAATADLPNDAVIRYEGGLSGLLSAISSAAREESAHLAAMSKAARKFAASIPWSDIAKRTMLEMADVLDRGSG